MSFEKNLLNFIAKACRDGAHSIFSPSGSAMWLHCPGSLIPNVLAEDSVIFEAVEGTVAHDVAEQWLKSGERPDHRIGEVVTVEEGGQTFEITIDESMLAYIQEYVDWCANLPGTHYVEQRVYFSELTPIPDQGGTADHFVCDKGRLIITDLKYGKGVQVFAARDRNDPSSLVRRDGQISVNGNSQAMIYALGVVFKWDWLYDFEDIEIRIAQPRLDHFDVWHTTKDELMRFADYVEERAKIAWQLNAPRRPSDAACQWCRVKKTCPAIVQIAHDVANDCFADLDEEVTSEDVRPMIEELELGLFEPNVSAPAEFSVEHLAKLLPFRGTFEKWFAEVAHYLESIALEGGTVPGYKLVESRSNRVFQSEQQALDLITATGIDMFDLYTLKFISPSGAETLLRKKGMTRKDAIEYLSPVVHKPQGKPTLARESDPRPEYVDPSDEVFSDLDL